MRIDASGNITISDLLTVNAGVSIIGDTTNEVTLKVKGVGSQTANLLTIQQSDGTEKLTVSASGVTTASSLSATNLKQRSSYINSSRIEYT